MTDKVTYTIRKNDYDEFVVRFRVNGVRKPTWDYFASDLDDAKATAETVCHGERI